MDEKNASELAGSEQGRTKTLSNQTEVNPLSITS